jgi:outer membrane protein X
MKKIALLAAIIALFGVKSYGQVDILVGGGLAYGSEIKNLGLDLRGDFRFDRGWVISPNLNFFFPKENNNVRTSWTAFNADVHYLLPVGSGFHFYPFGGLNFSSISNKVKNTDVKHSHSEIGLNIGMGLNANFGSNVDGFVDMKYVVSDFDQAVITFGVLVGI